MSVEVNIKKKFNGFHLDISFLQDNQIMGILGASGCGKSMTLKCIAGIETPDEGQIIVGDQVFFDSRNHINLPPQKRKVGYLFQNYGLFSHMTVEENIKIAIKNQFNKKNSREQDNETVHEIMGKMHLQQLEKRLPCQLSGGQQQRVALARMLVNQPEVILLDEPFSALDGHLKDSLQYELFSALGEFHGPVIMVSHNRDEIFRFCEDLAVIFKGNVVQKGNTREIFHTPTTVEAAKLTGCKNISRLKPLGEFLGEAVDWGMQIHTRDPITSDFTHVGIRAHKIVPSNKEKEYNTMEVQGIRRVESPFEVQYIGINRKFTDSEQIWWTRNKADFSSHTFTHFPEYLYFPPESLFLLKQEEKENIWM